MIVFLLACTSSKEPDTAFTPEIISAYANAGANQFSEINTEVEFDIGDSSGVSFSWDFGDGNRAEGERVNHQYSQPGMYSVVLTVEGSDGQKKTDSTRLTAHYPLLADPPQHSSTITIDENGVWAIFPEAGTLHFVSLDGSTQKTYPICVDPRQLVQILSDTQSARTLVTGAIASISV